MKYPIAFLVLAAAATAAAAPAPRPVLIGTNPDEVCIGPGEVYGLNPRGDNYLSVRAAPNVRARELDRLRTGTQVTICNDVGNGAWWGVVYSRNPNQDCRIAPSAGRPRPYPGPCRSGWVSGRYVRITAG